MALRCWKGKQMEIINSSPKFPNFLPLIRHAQVSTNSKVREARSLSTKIQEALQGSCGFQRPNKSEASSKRKNWHWGARGTIIGKMLDFSFLPPGWMGAERDPFEIKANKSLNYWLLMLMLNFTTTMFQNEIILTSMPQMKICDNIHCSPENVFGSDAVKADPPWE